MKNILHSLFLAMEEAVLDMKFLVPILFLVYLLIEYLSHKKEEKFVKLLSKDKKTGVLLGALLGCIPQCGFSTVMADMYNHKLINLGTLIAVFVATSDEAVPIMLTYPNQTLNILLLILTKLLLAIFFGYVFSFLEYLIKRKSVKRLNFSSSKISQNQLSKSNENTKQNLQQTSSFTQNEYKNEQKLVQNMQDEQKLVQNMQNESKIEQKIVGEANGDLDDYLSHHECLIDEKHLHHHEHAVGQKECSCCTDNIFLSALKHCLIIALYVFVANVVLNFVFSLVGEDVIASALNTSPILQIVLSPLIGLIPNCVSSVVLIELYLNGVLIYPALIGGLCAGSGVAMIVLFKNTKSFKKNMLILFSQYAIGVVIGLFLTIF